MYYSTDYSTVYLLRLYFLGTFNTNADINIDADTGSLVHSLILVLILVLISPSVVIPILRPRCNRMSQS